MTTDDIDDFDDKDDKRQELSTRSMSRLNLVALITQQVALQVVLEDSSLEG